MPLLAVDAEGNKIWARDVVKIREERTLAGFACKNCKAEMLFVDAQLKVKHFRHKVTCDCDTEPETQEHAWGKETVYDALKASFTGYIEPEDPIGRMKCDVHWLLVDKKVAFEIQATNYDPSVFDEKINYYTRKGYITVYLFVGDSFCRETRNNIYSLKEIEKRIFVDKKYGDFVLGGYLDDDGVFLPCFTHKLAKGRDGHCENRFIIWQKYSKQLSLQAFLAKIAGHTVTTSYRLPECKHPQVETVKHETPPVRYKEVCSDCGKYIKWIPNKEALKRGLTF
jgi:hypothetical protein